MELDKYHFSKEIDLRNVDSGTALVMGILIGLTLGMSMMPMLAFQRQNGTKTIAAADIIDV